MTPAPRGLRVRTASATVLATFSAACTCMCQIGGVSGFFVSPHPALSSSVASSSLFSTVADGVPPSSSPSSSASSLDLSELRSDYDEIEFPEALSKVDRLKRAAKFWSTAVPIIASYYGKMTELSFRETVLGECLTEEECALIWDEQHISGSAKLAEAVNDLKGFYVKTAQIIASRGDLFPKQYTDSLSVFTDSMDPMDARLVRSVVERELLHPDEAFEDVFLEFDDAPLGAASVAQVHRAVLSPAYGGPREVAVKVQRPSIESKLLGDIANLKAIAKPLRDLDALPLDYYTVFCELERQLADEFDFVAEAASMTRIADALGDDCPIVLPRATAGLVTRRVLVMDYLRGVPLSQAAEEMKRRGVDPDGPEAKLFGRKLLQGLTDAFGRSILETGFFHADPHPGNIFVLDDGNVGLIDFGQVKQISGRKRQTLAKVMVALDDRRDDEDPDDLKRIGDLALELGVVFKEDAPPVAPAAVAMWLFDGSVENLPGGYDKGELSPNSPVKALSSFPEDLVLVGRATVLIKGLSNRLGIPWSLSREWAPTARALLETENQPPKSQARVRFKSVRELVGKWARGKTEQAFAKLPSPVRLRFAKVALRLTERQERVKAQKNQNQN